MKTTKPLEALAQITAKRNTLDLYEQDWVLEARRAGYSWHKIGLALNQTGEGVRHRHGKMES
jgi:hypothetical protein